jgi:hypothetical protein
MAIVASAMLFHHPVILNHQKENNFNLMAQMIPMVSHHLLNLNESLSFYTLCRDIVSMRNSILLLASPCFSSG